MAEENVDVKGLRECERHEFCTESLPQREFAEAVELEVDSVRAIVARPPFDAFAYDETSVESTFVSLRHTIDPTATPQFHLLVGRSDSTPPRFL